MTASFCVAVLVVIVVGFGLSLFIVLVCRHLEHTTAHNVIQWQIGWCAIGCGRGLCRSQMKNEKRTFTHTILYDGCRQYGKIALSRRAAQKKIDQITNSQSRSFVLSCPCQVYISKTIIFAAKFYTRNVSVHITFETEQRE